MKHDAWNVGLQLSSNGESLVFIWVTNTNIDALGNVNGREQEMMHNLAVAETLRCSCNS